MLLLRRDYSMRGSRRGRSLSTRSNTTFKKRKLDDSFIADQPIITLIVEAGKTSRSFNIHKHLLYSQSLYFRASLGSEDKPKPLVLRDVAAESFETFSRWIYTKALVTDELDNDDDDSESDSDDDRDESEGGVDGNSDDTRDGAASEIAVEEAGETGRSDSSPDAPWYSGLNRKGRVFSRLLDLYTFATMYKAGNFKRAIMLEWQRFTVSTETLPCPTVVKQALDSLDIESPLCQFLILCYGHYTDHRKVNKSRFATLPSTFLTEVLAIVFKRLDGDWDIEKSDENWCEFHEHEDETDREECKKSRDKDPDVVAERQKNRRHLVRRWGPCC